jgi:hypothetical protein
MPARDDDGRFMSSRSRYDDDDDEDRRGWLKKVEQ